MYFYLKGKVSLHQKNSIVLEVNNIGYQIFVSHPDDYPLLEECLVYTVFYVREDEQFLVGFKTFEEKMLYSKLVQVKGVGPKTAINILGAAKLEELIDAINNSNLLFLKSLEGVGPKTASQIILDLKGKISFESSISGDKNLDDEFWRKYLYEPSAVETRDKSIIGFTAYSGHGIVCGSGNGEAYREKSRH